MEKYNYKQVEECILKWSKRYLSRYFKNIQLTRNEEDNLIFDLTFKNCLAQILVCKPAFAPYKNVSFEAMTINSKKAIQAGEPELIYFF